MRHAVRAGSQEWRGAQPSDDASPRTTALVVTYNAARLIPSLLETLGRIEELAVPLVVDNASTDGSAGVLERALPPGLLIRSGWNGGFGYANNLGLMRIRTPYTLLLNADARIGPESLGALQARLDEAPGVAAVQPRLGFWEWPEVTAGRGMGVTGTLRGFDLGYCRFEPEPGDPSPRRVAGVGAAASLWRTSVLRVAGGFDERLFMYFEDVDLCLRVAAAGHRFELLPRAWGLHMAGASSRRGLAEAWETRSAAILARKYLGGPRARLPLRAAASEIVDILRGVSSRRPPFRRLLALAGAALESSVEAEILPDLHAIPPSDLPVSRPAPAFHLDRRGMVTAGPGWARHGSSVSFLGFGGMSAMGAGRADIVLESRSPHTGRLWLGSEPGQPFCLPGGASRLRLDLPAGRSYIALDDRSEMPMVRLREFGFEG